MAYDNEYKTQKHFVKDGDDAYVRRPPRRQAFNTSGLSRPKRQPFTLCECGGKMKPRGAMGTAGKTTTKCTKCGRRVYTEHYSGKAGLAVCY